jgi:hypothetical protein
MTGPEHYANAESDLEHACRAEDQGRLGDMDYWFRCAQIHATLAAAPQPWIRCVETLHGTGHYRLNPMYIVYAERHKFGWLQVIDATGRSHQVLSDDEAKVEALGGQP